MTVSYKAWIKTRKTLGWQKWNPKVHPTFCLLCLKPFVPKSRNSYAVWDHCHTCQTFAEPPGSFRGYICSLCNSAEPWRHRKVAKQGIQHLIRNPEWQSRLKTYLEAHICPIPPTPPTAHP